MKKSAGFYITIVTIWILSVLAFFAFSVYSAIDIFAVPEKSLAVKIIAAIVLLLNVFIVAFMWFGAVRDLSTTFVYFLKRKKMKRQIDAISKTVVPDNPKILFLYCTCNDFDSEALEKSIHQDYENLKVVILDDSSKDQFREKIDKFAQKHDIEVFRRPKRRAFKAGALNDFLLTTKEEFDYFAILDKDGILPSNFCSEMLKYFYYDKKIGAVQAFHSPTQNENVFQDISALELLGGNAITLPVKNLYGSCILTGHAILISKKAFFDVGKFPELLTEDLAFSMDLVTKGYQIAFAPNVLCQEEYPIDYLAFKKRNCRWIEGQVQCIKQLSKNFLKSKNARWFEKLDILWCHILLSVFLPIFSFFLVINLAFLGAANVLPSIYFTITTSAMSLSLLTLVINNIFVHKGKQKWKIIPYILESLVIYTSILPAIIYAVCSTFLGKRPYFVITSNQSTKFGFKDMVKYTWVSFVFGLVIFVLGWIFCQSVFAVLVLSVSCCLAPFLLLLTNIKIKKRQIPIKSYFTDRQKTSKFKRKKIKGIVESVVSI